jgi:hypothetical protein
MAIPPGKEFRPQPDWHAMVYRILVQGCQPRVISRKVRTVKDNSHAQFSAFLHGPPGSVPGAGHPGDLVMHPRLQAVKAKLEPLNAQVIQAPDAVPVRPPGAAGK